MLKYQAYRQRYREMPKRWVVRSWACRMTARGRRTSASGQTGAEVPLLVPRSSLLAFCFVHHQSATSINYHFDHITSFNVFESSICLFEGLLSTKPVWQAWQITARSLPHPLLRRSMMDRSAAIALQSFAINSASQYRDARV